MNSTNSTHMDTKVPERTPAPTDQDNQPTPEVWAAAAQAFEANAPFWADRDESRIAYKYSKKDGAILTTWRSPELEGTDGAHLIYEAEYDVEKGILRTGGTEVRVWNYKQPIDIAMVSHARALALELLIAADELDKVLQVEDAPYIGELFRMAKYLGVSFSELLALKKGDDE